MQSFRQCFWLVVLGLVAACFALPGVWIFRQCTYQQDRRAADQMVRQLYDRRPPDVDVETWEMASRWAVTAYCNVCFCPEHVSHKELRLFRTDLEARLRGPVDLATVDWLWDRLGRIGPHGRQYQQMCEALYREHMEAVRAGRSNER